MHNPRPAVERVLREEDTEGRKRVKPSSLDPDVTHLRRAVGMNLYSSLRTDPEKDLQDAIDKAFVLTGELVSKAEEGYVWADHSGADILTDARDDMPSAEEMNLLTRTRIAGTPDEPFSIPIWGGDSLHEEDLREDDFLEVAAQALNLEVPLEEVFSRKLTRRNRKLGLHPLEFICAQQAATILGITRGTLRKRLKLLQRLRPDLDFDTAVLPIWLVPILAALSPPWQMQTRAMYEDFQVRSQLTANMTSFPYGRPAACILGDEWFWDLRILRDVCKELAARQYTIYHVGDLFGELCVGFSGGHHVYFRSPGQHPYMHCFTRLLPLGCQIRVNALYPETDPESNALDSMLYGHNMLIPPASIVLYSGKPWGKRLKRYMEELPLTTFFRNGIGEHGNWRYKLRKHFRQQDALRDEILQEASQAKLLPEMFGERESVEDTQTVLTPG